MFIEYIASTAGLFSLFCKHALYGAEFERP